MIVAKARIWTINVVILTIIGVAGFWGYKTLHPSPTPIILTTVSVTRGDVQSTVSASGKVVSPGDIGLAPLVSGTLKTLNVVVGQKVNAGEVLATLDTTNLKLAVDQAKAALITAQSNLNNAQASANNVQITLQQDKDAITTAQTNLDNEKQNLSIAAQGYQQTVDSALKALNDAKTNAAAAAPTYQSTVDTAQKALDTANFNLQNLEWTNVQTRVLDVNGAPLTAQFCLTYLNQYQFVNPNLVNTYNTNCSNLINDTNAIDTSQTNLNNAKLAQASSLAKDAQTIQNLQTAYDNAVTNQKNSLTKDSQALASYQSALKSAQDALTTFQNTQNLNDSSNSTTQLAINSALSTILIDDQNLAIAQKNLAAATITAPVSGTVASISTSVGGNVPTTFNNATNTTAATGFIVLTNTSGLRIYASFSEADTAKLSVGQMATFTFDSLPNVNATGKLINIDLSPTTSSGATTYGATFSIDNSVPGLRNGMTSSATVITGMASNVINVPATAITSRGFNSFVNVVTGVGKKQTIKLTPVVIGLKGDSADEIISGLKVGQQVSITTARTTSNGFAVGGVPNGFNNLSGSSGLRVGGGGGFGGGGGGFGG